MLFLWEFIFNVTTACGMGRDAWTLNCYIQINEELKQWQTCDNHLQLNVEYFLYFETGKYNIQLIVRNKENGGTIIKRKANISNWLFAFLEDSFTIVLIYYRTKMILPQLMWDDAFLEDSFTIVNVRWCSSVEKVRWSHCYMELCYNIIKLIILYT